MKFFFNFFVNDTMPSVRTKIAHKALPSVCSTNRGLLIRLRVVRARIFFVGEPDALRLGASERADGGHHNSLFFA